MDTLVIKEIRKFIQRTYQVDLIRGVLVVGLLTAVFVLAFTGLESIYWLSTTTRQWIWASYGLLSGVLLFAFVVRPLAFWLRLRSGLSWYQAAERIGKRNPALGERLKVYVELWELQGTSDMVRAGLGQQETRLEGLRLGEFVDSRRVFRLLGYLTFPLAAALLWLAIGGLESLLGPYQRVMRPDLAFNRPAPYELVFDSGVPFEEGEPYLLRVSLEGEMLPAELYVQYGAGNLLMQKRGNEYSSSINLSGDEVMLGFTDGEYSFGPYRLSRHRHPKFVYVETRIQPPAYTGQEPYTGDPNGVEFVAQGSQVEWTVRAVDADSVVLENQNRVWGLRRNQDGGYEGNDRVLQGYSYAIAVLNRELNARESIQYQWTVLRDATPGISLEGEEGDTAGRRAVFTDDYGIARIELIARRNRDWEVLEAWPGGNVRNGELGLDKVEPYLYDLAGEWAIRVWDNDQVNGSKSAISQVVVRKDARREIAGSIEEIERKLEEGKERPEPDRIFYNDERNSPYELSGGQKEKLREWLRKEEDVRKGIRDIARELGKRNLSPEFRERLEREMERNQEMEKYLEELEKGMDSMSKSEAEELKKEFEKKASLQQKNLMQILELSKKFEVRQLVTWLKKELDSEIDSLQSQEKQPVIGSSRWQMQDARLDQIMEQSLLLDELNKKLKKPL